MIPRIIHETYLGKCEVAAFLWSAPWIECIPLHEAAVGGLILKFRNRAGDRSIDLRGFLREHGLDDAQEKQMPFSWYKEHASWRSCWEDS